MDLGLNALTDDQLLELIQQACAELGVRDPYVRNLAQHTITTEAEQLTLRRGLARQAIEECATAYIEKLRAETSLAVKAAIADGSMRLLTPAQEARIIADTALKEKITAIDQVVQVIRRGPVATQMAIEERIEPGLYPDDYREFVRRREAEIARRAMPQRQASVLSPPPWEYFQKAKKGGP